MSALPILLLIIVLVVVCAVGALRNEEPNRRIRLNRARLDDRYRAATVTKDRNLANFLIELHRQNRETYRRIKEAGRKI